MNPRCARGAEAHAAEPFEAACPSVSMHVSMHVPMPIPTPCGQVCELGAGREGEGVGMSEGWGGERAPEALNAVQLTDGQL